MDHSGLGRGVPSWQHLQKETRENSFCCRKLNVGIRALPYPPPPTVFFPAGDPYTWLRPRTRVQEQPAWASPPSHLQTPRAARAACHRPASPQNSQGWKGLNTAAQLGKPSSVLQPLQPLPPLLPSAVPSPTSAPPAWTKQDRMVPCASLCTGSGAAAPNLAGVLSGTQSHQLEFLPVGCTMLGLSTSK